MKKEINMNVYKKCPILENDYFLLRYIREEDAEDLLKVYSDKKAVLLFNSDNCNGDIFYYTTLERMKKQIRFWDDEYNKEYYVRWSIIDKKTSSVIGTIELFNRKANDFFNNCGLLRLDLRSDYEKNEQIKKILEIIIDNAFNLFNCNLIATKAISIATERIKALTKCGFNYSEEKLIGHDGTIYNDYYIKNK